jgi:hypothetical protein
MDSAVVFSILLEERGGVGLAVAAKKCFFGDDGVLIGIIFFLSEQIRPIAEIDYVDRHHGVRPAMDDGQTIHISN